MARLARSVLPGIPHHVTQRGNRKQQTFFCDGDFKLYIDLLSEWTRRNNVEIWAYCLMPNHVHLIAVPESAQTLRQAIGETHRRYTRAINFRKDWRGHLWQGRFYSFAMDERHLLAAARYIELNPVKAGLVADPASYPWSSARAHLAGQDQNLVKVAPLLDLTEDWGTFLRQPTADGQNALIELHERTGRPLGNEEFIQKAEAILGRPLRPQKAGRKPSGS
ncbi:MAG: transposase [Elusimicrobiota bacterium]